MKYVMLIIMVVVVCSGAEDKLITQNGDSFNVVDGRIILADPGDDPRGKKNEKLHGVFIGVKTGKWNSTFIQVNHKGKPGSVASAIFTSDGLDVVLDLNKYIKTEYELGVDTGQAVVVNYSMFNDVEVAKKHNWKADPLIPEELWYSMCCDISNVKNHGVIPGGLVMGTGFGDGGYPVYVMKNDKGEIVRFYCKFLTDDEIKSLK